MTQLKKLAKTVDYIVREAEARIQKANSDCISAMAVVLARNDRKRSLGKGISIEYTVKETKPHYSYSMTCGHSTFDSRCRENCDGDTIEKKIGADLEYTVGIKVGKKTVFSSVLAYGFNPPPNKLVYVYLPSRDEYFDDRYPYAAKLNADGKKEIKRRIENTQKYSTKEPLSDIAAHVVRSFYPENSFPGYGSQKENPEFLVMGSGSTCKSEQISRYIPSGWEKNLRNAFLTSQGILEKDLLMVPAPLKMEKLPSAEHPLDTMVQDYGIQLRRKKT